MIAPGSSHHRKKTIQGTILWSKKGKKVSVSEDKRTTFEIEIHRCLAHVEIPEERRTEGNGTRRLANESTPVDQGQDSATSTGTLDREEMSELRDVLIETPVVEGSSTNHTIKQEESGI